MLARVDGASASFSALVEREPDLARLADQVERVRDDGAGSFFCSNHVWLPLASRLRQLLGVQRRGWSTREEGDPLYSSRVFEEVYVQLSRRLPPCRDCGCALFEPYREEQLGRTRGGSVPPRPP